MQRVDINLGRYPAGTLLADHEQFVSAGAVNDLAYGAVGAIGKIAPTGTTAGERVLLHQGPDTGTGHAAEVVIDVGTRPYGGEAIGIALLWATAGYQMTEGASSPVRDEDLGEENHLRVIVYQSTLAIDEVREGTTRRLYAKALHQLHRRIAIRAAHVDGEVLLWWNPTGVRQFQDRPLVRAHTLIEATAARPGLICGRDGKFLQVSFEYRVPNLPGTAALANAEEPAISLDPVRLRLTCDESRPPMETGMFVTHSSDTRLPERQERLSRVHLRDARMMLRPGHSYRAGAWMRTVDDEWLSVFSREFTLEGDGGEDFTLRDCLGREIIPGQGGENDDGFSPLEILVWPEELEPEVEIKTTAAPARIDLMHNADNAFRGVQRASVMPRRFEWDHHLEGCRRETLRKFLAETRGRTLPFLWTHPKTGEIIVARFADPRALFGGLEADLMTVTVSIVEEVQCLGEPPVGPESPGYSGTSSPHSSGPPTSQPPTSSGGGSPCIGCTPTVNGCGFDEAATMTLEVVAACVCSNPPGCATITFQTTTITLTRVLPALPDSVTFEYTDPTYGATTTVTYAGCLHAPEIFRWSFAIRSEHLTGYNNSNPVQGPCGEECSWTGGLLQGMTHDDFGVPIVSTPDKCTPPYSNPTAILCDDPPEPCEVAWLAVDATVETCCEGNGCACEGFRHYMGFCSVAP